MASQKQKKEAKRQKKSCSISKTQKYFYFFVVFVVRLMVVYTGCLIDDTPGYTKFTDSDYEMLSDAATHIINGGSPYERHTFRHAPMAAYICLVNNLIHPQAGKVLFCFFDVCLGVVFWQLVEVQKYSQPPEVSSKKCPTIGYVTLMLFNPFIVGMSTRGCNDNITTLLVFLSIFFVQKK